MRGAFSGSDRCRDTCSLSESGAETQRCLERMDGSKGVQTGLAGPRYNPLNWIFPPQVLTAPSRSAVAIKHEHKGNWLEEGPTVPFALFHRVGLSLGESGLLASSFVAGRMVSVLWLNYNINPVTAAHTLRSRFWTSGSIKATHSFVVCASRCFKMSPMKRALMPFTIPHRRYNHAHKRTLNHSWSCYFNDRFLTF